MTEPRNYVAELDAAVAAYLDAHEGGYVSAVAAKELLAEWQVTNPGLFAGWLRARGPELLTEYISTESRSRTSRAPRRRVQGAFAQFADEFEAAVLESDDAGQDRAYQRWSKFYSVTVDGIRQRRVFHLLNADQLAEVRDNFQASANNYAFYARVVEAIRRQVVKAGPDATVESVYSPEELERMFERK